MRQTRDVEKIRARQIRVADCIFRTATDHVQLTLKSHVIFDSIATTDKNLSHKRFIELGGFTQIKIIGRHLAPSQQTLSFASNDFFDNFREPLALFAIVRQKHHANAIVAGVRQLKAQALASSLQEFMRYLY